MDNKGLVYELEKIQNELENINELINSAYDNQKKTGDSLTEISNFISERQRLLKEKQKLESELNKSSQIKPEAADDQVRKATANIQTHNAFIRPGKFDPDKIKVEFNNKRKKSIQEIKKENEEREKEIKNRSKKKK